MFKQYNPNPEQKRVGDCTIRAISKVMDQSWEQTYSGMTIEGFIQCDMPSANSVWGAFLKRNGFTRHIIPNDCPDCYTVQDFCNDYSHGTYLLALDSHVVAVVNGDYYDTWDSGYETPIYYWKRKEE